MGGGGNKRHQRFTNGFLLAEEEVTEDFQEVAITKLTTRLPALSYLVKSQSSFLERHVLAAPANDQMVQYVNA
jgi:hypothetical protein